MRRGILALGAVLTCLFALVGAASASVYLDEGNVSSLSGSAIITHLDGATPASGNNVIFLGGNNPPDPGDATWNIQLVPGQKYRVTARRQVIWVPDREPHTSYKIDIDGALYMLDYAATRTSWENDKFVSNTFLGYYTPTTSTTTVRAYDGDWWIARLDYIRFDAATDVYFDENTPNLEWVGSGNAENTLYHFAPDNYGSLPVLGPNSFVIPVDEIAGPDSGVTGNVTLVPGATYRVYASRGTRPDARTSFDVEMNGVWFAHDSALSAGADFTDYNAEALLGEYTPTYTTNSVRIYNPGEYAARPDYIRFERVFGQSLLLDESNAVLAGDAASAYSALATPNDGSTPNYIIMGVADPPGPGSATWTVNLTPGQRYSLTTRRTVLWNNELRFGIHFGGAHYITDLAYGPTVPDTMQEWTAMGYCLPTTLSNTITAQDPGGWAARIDWMRLTPTTDIYFDENTPVTFEGNASTFTFNTDGCWPWNPMTMPIIGPNGFYFDQSQGPSGVTGNITLIPGATYQVYASRQVLDNGYLGYDVSFNRQLFVHDGAVTRDMNHNDFLEEELLGEYTATTADTEVKLSGPGQWGSRPDYLRLVLVSLPATVDTVGAAKNLSVGTRVAVTQPAVATVDSSVFSDGSYYVEDPSRSSGIKVISTEATPTEVYQGWGVSLIGDIALDENGQKCIRAFSVVISDGESVGPLGMTCNNLAAEGQDPSGLLVHVWGRVLSVNSYYAEITDGGPVPVKVVLSGLVWPITKTINENDYISVVGLAGLTTGGAPAVRPRNDADVTTIVSAQ